jgi:hypothetical protein
MMTIEQKIREHRSETFGLSESTRVSSLEGAIDFVKQRGMMFFWPVKKIDLPDLWTAVAGPRPVASAHDDPGHITWRWKDSMLDQKRWYYGKLLRSNATLVSLELLPKFYALSERVADLDDFRLAYEAGHLSREARLIAEVLLSDGAQNTIELRRRTQLSGRSSRYPFQRGLVELQRGLWALPVGVAEAGAWRYAFVYELFDRWLPRIVQHARSSSRESARLELTRRYLDAVGAADAQAVARLFRWEVGQVRQTLAALEKEGAVLQLEDQRWVTRAVLNSVR